MKDWIYNAREYFNNGIDAKYLWAREDKFREAIEKCLPKAGDKTYTIQTYFNKHTWETTTTVDWVDIEVVEMTIKNKEEMKRKYSEIMSK